MTCGSLSVAFTSAGRCWEDIFNTALSKPLVEQLIMIPDWSRSGLKAGRRSSSTTSGRPKSLGMVQELEKKHASR